MEQKVFVCLGLPCSGKGTQSRILAEMVKAHRIESGVRLDMIMKGEIFPELQELAQKVRKRPGELSSAEKDALMIAQIGDVSHMESNHIVLDGFGRNAAQYKILCDVFGKWRLYFIVFNITAKTMNKRAEGRFINPQTRESFMGLSQVEATQLGYEKRESDTPEVLARRLKSFQNYTVRVFNTHNGDTGNVYEVNAGHTKVEDVTKDMMSKIRHLL